MFKKSSKKKGAIRKRKLSEGEEQKEDEVDQEEVEKLKLAKLKRELLTKKAGVSAVALAKGKKISKKAELTDDPFKLKSGTVLTTLILILAFRLCLYIKLFLRYDWSKKG